MNAFWGLDRSQVPSAIVGIIIHVVELFAEESIPVEKGQTKTDSAHV